MKKYVLILLLLGIAVCAQDEAPAEQPAAEKSEAPAAAPAAPAPAPKPPEPPKKPPRIRSGYIAKAEFTSEKPSSEGESRLGKASSSAWAVVTIDLDPGRALSVFDYVLSKDGTEYPCLDMAENDDTFSGMLRNYSSMNPRKCRLVFGVPSADDEYEIVFKLADDPNRVKLNVKAPPPPAEPSAQPAENKTESADAGKSAEKSEEKSGGEKSDSDSGDGGGDGGSESGGGDGGGDE